MTSVYVIQDKDYHVWAATYEEPTAIKICKENPGSSYRNVPFYISEGTVINVIAGPIPKEDLNRTF
jgi:hypothetical protein